MRTGHWQWLLFAAISLAYSAQASAQTGSVVTQKPQIINELPAPTGADMFEFFRQLGQRSQADDLAEKLSNLPPEAIAELRKLQENPALAETVKNLMESRPDVPPELKKWLRDMPLKEFQQRVNPDRLQDLRRSIPNAGTAPVNPAGVDKDKLKNRPVPAKPTFGGVGIVGNDISNAQRAEKAIPASVRPPDSPRPNSKIGRGIMEWAKSMERLDPSLARSPALQKVIRELSKHLGEDDARWQKLADNASTVKEKFARLGESLQLQRLLPKDGLTWPRGLTPSHLSGNASRRERVVEASGAPAGFGAGGSGAGSRGFQGLVTGVVLGIIAVVAWSLLFKTRRAEEAKESGRNRLGPWPLEPSTIATRADLIQAFEYLSLLRLGSPARNWNHEVIGQQLGEDTRGSAAPLAVLTWDPLERRHAADELARVYEQARYAPMQEELSEGALAAARRDLCFLAGTPAS